MIITYYPFKYYPKSDMSKEIKNSDISSPKESLGAVTEKPKPQVKYVGPSYKKGIVLNDGLTYKLADLSFEDVQALAVRIPSVLQFFKFQ